MDNRWISDIFYSQKKTYEAGATREIKFRKIILEKLKEEIKQNEDIICDALKKDLGKSIGESLSTEIGLVISEIDHTLKNLKKWMRVEKKRRNLINIFSKSFLVKEPYGVVLVISPWNYPFQLSMSPIIGAIAAGNCVILKPSEKTPNVSKVISDMVERAFHREYLAVVLGEIEVGEYLLELPFNKIFFTGSTTVGKIVMKKAAENLTPVVLELGGKSPAIVERSADVCKAAKKIAFGKCINSGQTCVAPDYVILHENIKDLFYQEYRKAVEEFYGENIKNSIDYGRIIDQEAFRRIIRYMDSGEVIIGGNFHEREVFIEPTVIEIQNLHSLIMKEEIFGPILPVIIYSKREEIKEIVLKNPDPLALYVFSENGEFINYIIDSIPAGGCCINETIMHLTNGNLPFGGRGKSGMGRYHGKYSFDTFTHEKSVLERTIRIDLKDKYPPYNQKKIARIKKLFKL